MSAGEQRVIRGAGVEAAENRPAAGRLDPCD